MITVFADCSFIFKVLSDEITSIELQFIGDFKLLKRFIKDCEIISVNERLERYVNGLISLKNTIVNIYQDITSMCQVGKKNPFLWPDLSSLNSAPPNIIAHYVVRTLGHYMQLNETNLDNAFADWTPNR